MTKIAHITTVDMSLRYLLLDQLCSIKEAGYEVIGISSPGSDVRAIEAAGIRHIAVPMTRKLTPIADLVSLWRLYRIIRREQFDIVHTHTPKAGLLGQLAARLAGVPIIIKTIYGFYFHDRTHPVWRRFYIFTEKIAAFCSNRIFSANSEDVRTALKNNICSKHKIELAKAGGIGVNLEMFDRKRLDKNHIAIIRKKFGFSENDQVVGFVGRLVAEKGIIDLLDAARLVLKDLPKAKFLFVGPTDLEKSDALRPQIADTFGIADVCIFTGLRQDMPEMYRCMDVFVLPSHREGFPVCLMEASAMGVPCIVTNIRGCREAVEHNRNGVLVPLGDVQALAKAIIELLTDREKALKMGEEGRKIAEERFDERHVFEKVKSEYTRLMREKGLKAT